MRYFTDADGHELRFTKNLSNTDAALVASSSGVTKGGPYTPTMAHAATQAHHALQADPDTDLSAFITHRRVSRLLPGVLQSTVRRR